MTGGDATWCCEAGLVDVRERERERERDRERRPRLWRSSAKLGSTSTQGTNRGSSAIRVARCQRNECRTQSPGVRKTGPRVRVTSDGREQRPLGRTLELGTSHLAFGVWRLAYLGPGVRGGVCPGQPAVPASAPPPRTTEPCQPGGSRVASGAGLRLCSSDANGSPRTACALMRPDACGRCRHAGPQACSCAAEQPSHACISWARNAARSGSGHQAKRP